MSQENVELARRTWELWSQGADDEVARRLAPDVEWHHQIGLGTPAEGIYRGREGVLELSRSVRDSFGLVRVELEDVRDISATEVLTLGTMHLEGRGSGAAVTTPFGAVTEILDGLAVRQRFWTDQNKALEAVKLREQAVSLENVEVVRRLYALLEDVVHGQLDEVAFELTDPDIVWDVSRRTFDPGVFHGHQGLRDLAAQLAEVWESGTVEPAEFIATGDEVVVPVRLHFVSRSQGNTVTANAAHVWTLREGKIIRHCAFQTKAEALDAAGLRG